LLRRTIGGNLVVSVRGDFDVPAARLAAGLADGAVATAVASTVGVAPRLFFPATVPVERPSRLVSSGCSRGAAGSDSDGPSARCFELKRASTFFGEISAKPGVRLIVD
jgi:hypothetical protein